MSGLGSVRMGDPTLRAILLGALLFLAAYFLLLPHLPQAWRTPGSFPLYFFGIAGGALLLLSFGFVLAKRGGRGGSPPAWFAAHVAGAVVGAVLVAVHSAGSLTRPPALLLLALLALAALGVWARLRLSGAMAAVFASRHQNFAPAEPVLRKRFEEILAAKVVLLARLDPAAAEGTFSLAPAHWLRRPAAALAYARLAGRERRLIGARKTLGFGHAHWRRLHILLAVIFVAGLLAHVFTVTFFAEYAASGRQITWWHISR
ncbi:MAG: hypothetical protein V3S29_13950 [bacterium]